MPGMFTVRDSINEIFPIRDFLHIKMNLKATTNNIIFNEEIIEKCPPLNPI